MIIDPAVRRLHQLAWQPGAWMHYAWWRHLDLEPWRTSYLSCPACRPSIDRLIVARRGFPLQPLPGSLDGDGRRLIEVEPRWPALITALGVIALACVDHLLLRPHRQALAAHLDSRSCDQLLAICGSWNVQAVRLAPEALGNAALSAGTRWLRRDTHRSVAAAFLSTLLAPCDGAASDPPESCAIEWIITLSRFL
jgi:hypothetical protein